MAWGSRCRTSCRVAPYQAAAGHQVACGRAEQSWRIGCNILVIGLGVFGRVRDGFCTPVHFILVMLRAFLVRGLGGLWDGFCTPVHFILVMLCAF